MSGGELAVLPSESRLRPRPRPTGETTYTRSLILLHSQLYISRHGTGVLRSVFTVSCILFFSLCLLPCILLPFPPSPGRPASADDNGKTMSRFCMCVMESCRRFQWMLQLMYYLSFELKFQVYFHLHQLFLKCINISFGSHIRVILSYKKGIMFKYLATVGRI